MDDACIHCMFHACSRPKRLVQSQVYTSFVYLVRKKEVNFILSYYTNLSHTGQEKFTSFFRTRYTLNIELVVHYVKIIIKLFHRLICVDYSFCVCLECIFVFSLLYCITY